MLDKASLEAIALEARNCFLYEDAPEYIKILTHGIEELNECFNSKKLIDNLTDIYKELGRAAHSIKGGAGMAEMLDVSKLAHKIEDIFEALEENKVKDQQTALQLLTIAIEELDNLIDAEINGEKIANEIAISELISALEEFLNTVENVDELTEIGFANQDFINTALMVDLEACLERVEEILNDSSYATENNMIESLKILEEECTLLGQALNCVWLVEIGTKINQLKKANKLKISELAVLAITEIKYLRSQFIEQKEVPKFSEKFSQLLPQEKQEIQKIQKQVKSLSSEEQNHSINLRVPLEKVTQISEALGELIIHHERLKLYDNQLKQASFNLKKRTKSLLPLKEQIEFFYDKLTITEHQEINKNNSKKLPNFEEFDTLQFDTYFEIHSALQGLSELMVQVQEIREDVDFLSREFQETLISMRQSINNLDQDLNQVRLVPFITLAGSFIKPIEKLNKEHHKSVELIIEGQQILIDQTIIEALRTPLIHIIRNAFDHGIESPKQRKKSNKNEIGRIRISAKLQSNYLMLTIADDGQGININKIYQKATSLGLLSANIPQNQLSQEQILDLIFSPGFSTCKKVSDLSGRGIGMDIVKVEIQKLRGTIKVKTKAGKGTQFTLCIPLALNIIRLLLVRCQQKTLAIPSDNVWRIIRISDYQIQDNQILWEQQLIPLYILSEILPYNSRELLNFLPQNSPPNIGLLLKISNEKIFVAIDGIIDEKELVTKGFDDTVSVPAYMAACTVLGTGEVVPILVPDYLKQLLNNLDSKVHKDILEQAKTTQSKQQISILIIDDSIAVRRTLQRILTQSGYQIVQCRDGKEAWDTLQNSNQNFHLAICDLEMPRFDGFKVLKLIRHSQVWQNLPVIILTSRESELHREKALNLGANAYLTKPFNPLNILATIDSLI